jgi:hypothetical protein
LIGGLVLFTVVAPAFADAEVASTEQALTNAVALFRQGKCREAAPLLERVTATTPADLDAVLLLGICRFRLHQWWRAEPLLRAAARSSDAETAGSARIFLGLLASEQGSIDAARTLLGQVSTSAAPDLAQGGRELWRKVRPRIVNLVFVLRPEFESNVPLLPIAAQPQITTGQRMDGDVLLLGSLTLTPLRTIGFTIDETASYRQQFTLLDYDIFANTLGLGYDYLGRNDRVHVRYAFDVMTLGSALLSLGHLAEAGYRRRIVADFGLGLSYALHYRDYFPLGYEPFSGPSQTGVVEASWGTPEQPFEVAAGYLIIRDDTTDPVFTATAQGARLRLRTQLGRILELRISGWAVDRPFLVSDPTEGLRHDTQVSADASLSVELHRHVGLIVGGSLLRNLSTVADFDYLKLTAYLGLAVGYAGPNR